MRGNVPARVAALDGLRGLAVAAVVAYHGGYLAGGYLGVDLFFVLSGFLITSLLLGETEASGGVSLRAFWSRRARRLAPAMLLLIAVVGKNAWRFGDAHQLAGVRRDGVAALTSTSNWVQIWAHRDYWAGITGASPLQHLWSLSIEAQFYLVWPLVVLGAARTAAPRPDRRPARVVAWICGVGAAVSFGLGAALVAAGGSDAPIRAYYGTDTRCGGLLLGGLVAALQHERIASGRARAARPSMTVPASAAATIVLAGAVVALEGGSVWLWRGGAVAFTVAAATIVGLLTAPAAEGTVPRRGTAWSHRIVGAAPFRLLGTISYGVYLWHWPVILQLDHEATGRSGVALFALRVIVTLALATISYVALERPVRRSRSSGRGPALVGVIATLLTMALLLWSTRSAAAGQLRPVDPVRDLRLALAGGPPAPDRRLLPDGTPVRLLALGDSVGAENLGLAAERLARGSATLVAMSGGPGPCPVRGTGDPAVEQRPPDYECRGDQRAWERTIEQFDPNVVLIAHGALSHALGEFSPDASSGSCDADFGEGRRRGLAAAVDFFRRHDVQVVLTTIADYRPRSGRHTDADTACLNRYVREVASSRPDVVVVDLAAWMCPEHRCRTTIAGRRLRTDGLHFADDTAEIALLWILRQALGPWGGP